MASILVVEDEVLLAKSIMRTLTARGHGCAVAHSAEQALELFKQTPSDIVLLDVQLPGMSGIEAVASLRKIDPGVSVIIITAYGTMAVAIEAMRAGVSDFLRKPLDMEEVHLSIDRALANAHLRQTVEYYHDLEVGKTDEDRIVAESKPMRDVQEHLRKLTVAEFESATSYPSVLLRGETGTGKDLIARKLHYEGALSDQPFVEVNCTTLPRGLEEAELFGYARGAFTGADRSKQGLLETANGGTVFFNEIGDLAIDAQTKLLQVIERKTFRRVGGLSDVKTDIRIIAASHADLEKAESFREDLFYRLNSVVIEVPPLRDRREDIVVLTEMFLQRFARKYGKEKQLTPDACRALQEYSWPGNVRELRQLMERVTFLTDAKDISASDLGLAPVESATTPDRLTLQPGLVVEFPDKGIDLELTEKELIVKALELCNDNVSEAARKLNVGREALRYRIKKHGLE